MPALIERPKMSLQMWAALKAHIMRERERKKQEQEADEAIERLRREQELKRKQDAMTLEEIKDQVSQSEKKLKELKDEKHQLFMQLKKVLHEDDTRRRALIKEANEMAAAAQAAANQAYASHHQALNAVGVNPPQPLYIQNLSRTPVLYKMSPQPPQGTSMNQQHPNCLKRTRSPSPPQSIPHSQTTYQPQFAYKAQVTAFGPKLVPYPTVSSGQTPVYYTAHHIVPANDAAAAAAAAATIYGAGYATSFTTAAPPQPHPTESALKQHVVAPPSSQGYAASHLPQAFQRPMTQQPLDHGGGKVSGGTAPQAAVYADDKFYVQTGVLQRAPVVGGSLTTGQPVVSVSRQVNGSFVSSQPQQQSSIQRHQYASQPNTRFY